MYDKASEIMREQYGKDVVMSLATCKENRPSVRMINAYYKEGAFYITSYATSRKVCEITDNTPVALYKDLITVEGICENIGNPKEAKNGELAVELRKVFYKFYDQHVNEKDPNTCILKVTLTDAVIFDENTKYTIDFKNGSATAEPFENYIINI